MSIGFGITDLMVCSVISKQLQFLSKNPKHLEYILGMLREYNNIQDHVGVEHIKQCIDFIVNNEVHIAPYYEVDIKKTPSIVVINSGVEAEQFIGDQSGQFLVDDCNFPIQLPRIVFTEWDASSYNGTIMKVAKEYALDKKLWHNVFIKNGDFISRMDGLKIEDDAHYIYLKDELPSTVPLKGWQAVSSLPQSGLLMASSMDDVTVQMKLTTTGDYSVHRLLSIVLRYCIKKSRLDFDSYGLQVATFSYSPPALSDEADMHFESVYTITGKSRDLWIEREFDFMDEAANMVVCGTAESESEGNEDVFLE